MTRRAQKPGNQNNDRNQSILLTSRATVASILLILSIGLVVSSSLAIVVRIAAWQLPGWTGEWLNNYSKMVEGIINPLFGWIDLWWMQVTPIEGHLIIIGVVTLTTAAHHTIKIGGDRITTIVLFVSYFIFIVALPLIALPGWFGSATTIINLAVLVAATFSSNTDSDTHSQ